ncbi:hypothetical protein PHMEG_00026839, partial [Phytophthora megakarya]
TISGFQAPPVIIPPSRGRLGSDRLWRRVLISAIYDLKEFTGKDMDEDRARAWIGKVKSAFQRYQATVEEKCLTFADLTVGPAKNCHRQLSRTTKIKWADLLESFQTQYCGLGMSVAWQYYHARKRSDENPLVYLLSIQPNLKIKDGNPKARREHVDHYIETLGEPELADRLTLLRLADVDEFEEVLRAWERAKSSQRRSAFGSKFRQKAPASAPTAPARAAVRAIQAHDPSSESEGVSGSDGSDSEGDLWMIFLAAAEEKTQIQRDPERKRLRDPGFRIVAARETEITKIESAVPIVGPGNTQIWTAGNRGHPTDRCLYACRGCGGILQPDPQMVRSDSTPRAVPRTSREDNKLGRSAGWNPTVRAQRSRYCIYAYVNKATPDQDRKKSGLRGNTCNLHSYTTKIASLPQI